MYDRDSPANDPTKVVRRREPAALSSPRFHTFRAIAGPSRRVQSLHAHLGKERSMPDAISARQWPASHHHPPQPRPSTRRCWPAARCWSNCGSCWQAHHRPRRRPATYDRSWVARPQEHDMTQSVAPTTIRATFADAVRFEWSKFHTQWSHVFTTAVTVVRGAGPRVRGVHPGPIGDRRRRRASCRHRSAKRAARDHRHRVVPRPDRDDTRRHRRPGRQHVRRAVVRAAAGSDVRVDLADDRRHRHHIRGRRPRRCIPVGSDCCAPSWP